MKTYTNDFWQDVFRRYKGGSPKAPKALPPTPIRYSAEAEAAKRDILERGRGAKGRAASNVSSPALVSVNPNLDTKLLEDKLG